MPQTTTTTTTTKTTTTTIITTTTTTIIEWMNGVLGHDTALLRLYWARDNLGEWDEFAPHLG